ncbi:p-cresol methylhydroxylase subunit [Sphingomonas paucimobilis]|nr:p-cresol methylhydroxylase subunit [Sphingomonas paucimobilis]
MRLLSTASLLAAAALTLCASMIHATNAAPAAQTEAPAAHPGKMVYDRWCAACHGPGDGGEDYFTKQIVPRLPGTNALRVKYQGELPELLEERKDLTPETVAYFVRHGVSIMPSFRKTEISDRELADLGAYLSRNTPRE